MKRHVSLVLIPIDDYTRQVVAGNYIKPWVEWENEPIWKQGYYIFTNMKQDEFILHVESSLYQNQDLRVTLEENKTTVLKLYLLPSESYAVSKSTIAISGKGQPGKSVYVYSTDIRQKYKLLKDYEPGDNIGIFHPKELDLSGKQIWLEGRKERFRVTLGEQSGEEENYYEIDGPSMNIRKVETDIFLVYSTSVREDGTFYLLFPTGKEDIVHAVIEHGEMKEEITLNSKITNYLDLSKGD